jgi:hypothetical protein
MWELWCLSVHRVRSCLLCCVMFVHYYWVASFIQSHWPSLVRFKVRNFSRAFAWHFIDWTDSFSELEIFLLCNILSGMGKKFALIVLLCEVEPQTVFEHVRSIRQYNMHECRLARESNHWIHVAGWMRWYVNVIEHWNFCNLCSAL